MKNRVTFTNLNTCIRNCPSSDLGETKLLCLALIYPGGRVHSRGGTGKDMAIYSDKEKSTEESNIFVFFVVSSFTVIKEGGEILICDLNRSILDTIHKVAIISRITSHIKYHAKDLRRVIFKIGLEPQWAKMSSSIYMSEPTEIL